VTDWNYADIFDTVVAAQPGHTAIRQGDRSVSWAEFDDAARGFGQWILDADVAHQDKVAVYLYNSPEYLIAVAGAFRVGCVPVNTNYRYGTDELTYLWDNADATVVVFHGTFTSTVDAVRAVTPKVKAFIFVDDGTAPCPEWATPFSDVVATSGPSVAPWGRSPDDLLMLYTGGTTGMPKGVMWRQDDLFGRLNPAGFRRYEAEDGLDGIARDLAAKGPGVTLLPACPLMHGTGLFTALETLAEGGTVSLLPSRHYDPLELAATIERDHVNVAVIVGDPFARPLLTTLRTTTDAPQISSLVAIMSSGAMWSEEIKQGLLDIHPGMVLIDAFSSSEALGMGSSVSSAKGTRATASFTLGPSVIVIGEDGRPVTPGSGVIGMIGVGGRNPLGYYKDPVKSAATFKEIDGIRYSIPGDFATVGADGTIQLLGRGSQCINTAGEKVFPEEVEEALKTHGAVADACVVGIPDERFGERVVAAVELHPGTSATEEELIATVKAVLASYKAPRQLRFVETIGRSPSGKMDYGRHKREAVEFFATA
jgi:3-oxocholest-4-en-26-oate---CoA ligase